MAIDMVEQQRGKELLEHKVDVQKAGVDDDDESDADEEMTDESDPSNVTWQIDAQLFWANPTANACVVRMDNVQAIAQL